MSGRTYANKNKVVFVASTTGNCPTINLARLSKDTKFRDDFSKGLKVKKTIAKVIFKTN